VNHPTIPYEDAELRWDDEFGYGLWRDGEFVRRLDDHEERKVIAAYVAGHSQALRGVAAELKSIGFRDVDNFIRRFEGSGT
jgi:hypothetical protein